MKERNHPQWIEREKQRPGERKLPVFKWKSREIDENINFVLVCVLKKKKFQNGWKVQQLLQYFCIISNKTEIGLLRNRKGSDELQNKSAIRAQTPQEDRLPLLAGWLAG